MGGYVRPFVSGTLAVVSAIKIRVGVISSQQASVAAATSGLMRGDRGKAEKGRLSTRAQAGGCDCGPADNWRPVVAQSSI